MYYQYTHSAVSTSCGVCLLSYLPPYLLPTTYYLLPTTYYLLPTTYYLLPTTYYLLPTTYYLLPTTYYLPPTTYYLLPTTYYLLPTTYYLLPTTNSLVLRTAHDPPTSAASSCYPPHTTLTTLATHEQECGFFLLIAMPSPLSGETTYELLAAAGVAAGGTVSKQVIARVARK
jgi:hypothetical protein